MKKDPVALILKMNGYPLARNSNYCNTIREESPKDKPCIKCEKWTACYKYQQIFDLIKLCTESPEIYGQEFFNKAMTEILAEPDEILEEQKRIQLIKESEEGNEAYN